MPLQQFLSPKQAILPQLYDELLPASGSGCLDLSSIQLICPTRQSARRLREGLTRCWRQRGGSALLGLQASPPSIFLQGNGTRPTAQSFDWKLAWQEALMALEPSQGSRLFPEQTLPMESGTAMDNGSRFQQLRMQLFDAGLRIEDVAAQHPLLSEQQRWIELARLEENYLKRLHQQDLEDPVEQRRLALQQYQPPKQLERLLFLCVPDPSPVLIPLFEQLDQHSSLSVEVWIQAEETEARFFDSWGRPDESWSSRPLPARIDEPGLLALYPDPASLQRELEELFVENPDYPDLALGLLDPDLAPFLTRALRESGSDLYDPSPQSLEHSPLYRCLERIHVARVQDNGEGLRDLWRDPLLLPRDPREAKTLLHRWDRYAQEQVPMHRLQIRETLEDELLISHWQRIETFLDAETPLEILERFEELFAELELSPADAEQRFRLRQIEQAADIIQQAARRSKAGLRFSLPLLLEGLREEHVDPPRIEPALTAEGWLELPYHPGGSLLLLGMQEGVVPDASVADAFLPDQLRRELGLRHDRNLAARDAYLLHNLLRSRPEASIRICLCRQDATGNPLLPSRLLFAAESGNLVPRVKRLMHSPADEEPSPAPRADLIMDPLPQQEKLPQQLSVSDLNAYLRCPFRFYLSKVLGLQVQHDRDRELGPMPFGTLLHQVLHLLLQESPRSEDTWNQIIAEQLAAESLKRFGSAAPLQARMYLNSARMRLEAAGRLQRQMWQEGWEVRELEKTLSVQHGPFEIRGRLDRVDLHPEWGWRIIDYKSSDSSKTPAQIHLGTPDPERPELDLNYKGKDKRWLNLQLPLYRWLWRNSGQDDSQLTCGYIQLPKAVSDSAWTAWKEEAELAPATETVLDAILQRIEQQIWEPMAPTDEYDEFRAFTLPW